MGPNIYQCLFYLTTTSGNKNTECLLQSDMGYIRENFELKPQQNKSSNYSNFVFCFCIVIYGDSLHNNFITLNKKVFYVARFY